MGTGKSSTGRILARKLSYDFVDTDNLIQSRQGQSIAEIFTAQGEAAFRQMEADIAIELANEQGHVIATGGRLMLDGNNAETLEKTGRVFCLTADAETLIKRLSSPHARKKRPLLQSCEDLGQYISQLLNERGPAYQRFEQIDTSHKKPFQIAALLTKKMQQSQAQ